MTKKKNSDFGYDVQIQSIELLETSIRAPVDSTPNLQDLHCKVGIETKAQAENKGLLVIVSVEVRSDDFLGTLGSVVVSCFYTVAAFNQLVEIQPDGRIKMPQPLADHLNLQSMATTRGMMFALFKGTFLHQVLLPMVDPRSLQTAY